MNETVLRNRLLATVPALDDADWLDVRGRARAIEAPRRRNRRLIAIAAVLAILTALVVNPALGLGERLLDWVEGDPAPERVKQAFRRESRPTRLVAGHRVIFEQRRQPPPDLAHVQLAIGLQSSVGPVYLWVAPAGGASCTLLEIEAMPDLPDGRLNASVDCNSPTAERPIDYTLGATRVGDGYFSYVRGQVRATIVRLEVTLSNGEVEPIRLVDGFFLAELPWSTLAERTAGCEAFPAPFERKDQDPRSVPCFVTPVEFRGFDANGTLVALAEVARPRRPLTPLAPFQTALTIELFSGREARIEYAPADRGGGLCWRVRWGGQTSASCGPAVKERSLPIGLMYSGVGKNQTVLLEGPVGSGIARVDLIWDDGTSERLRLEHGFVLKQIDPYGARWPAKLVGRDESGRVVAEHEVR